MKTFYAVVMALVCLGCINRFANSLADDLPQSEWEEHVRCRILKFWRPYDADARQKLVYQIDIVPTGRISATKLLKSSGDKLTDDTARYNLSLITQFLGFSGNHKRTLAIHYNELPSCKEHYGKKIEKRPSPQSFTRYQTPQNVEEISKVDFDDYMRKVQGKIKQRLRNPHKVKNERVIVRFIIHNNGTVSELHISQSSGSEDIEKLVLEAVNKAAPFPAFPKDYPGTTLPFEFGVDYNIGHIAVSPLNGDVK